MLYVVNHLKYKYYLNQGPCKYIYKLYKPTLKPLKLGYISEKEKELGWIVGINLKDINYRDNSLLKKYISDIKSLKDDKIKTLYIEDIQNIPLENIKRIELETGLTIAKGLNIKLLNILPILNKIYQIRKEDLEDKEVLILCKDKDLAIKIIKTIWDRLSFISLVNFDDSMGDIYKEIFDERGISLYQPNVGNLNIKTYHIIINLYDGYIPQLSEVRGNTIIFDYSSEKPFLNLNRHFVISDLNFKIKNNELGINDLIPHIIPSALYEELIGVDDEKVYQIFTKNKLHILEDYISNFNIGVKGSF